jgi:hypothetical protein
MKKLTSILLISIAVLSGCKKEDAPVAADFGYDYFPDKVGTWVEYQVDSAWYDEGFSDDSVSYRLKRVIAAHYTDPEGRPSMRIEQFKLIDDEWVIRDVWTATRTSGALEMTEENIRRLKLSFPVREGRTWDTNIYNTEADLEVAARSVGSAASVNDLQFPNTVLVQNTVPPNQIEARVLEEKYASGVGMVEHHWYYSRRDIFNGPIIVSQKYDMKAVAYGSE